jgi:hypothetical protein
VNFVADSPAVPFENNNVALGAMTTFRPIEPQITVNPQNPSQLVVSQQNALEFSTDGGKTFKTTQFFPTAGGAGDTSTVFDSKGNLYWANLAQPSGGIGVYITQVNTTTGTLGATYPVDSPPLENPGTPSAVQDSDDKAFIAADANGNLFAVFDRQTSTGWQILLKKSTDQGQTWPTTATVASGEGYSWPAYLSVAPNGDVYVAYHLEPLDSSGNLILTSGQVKVARYSNDLSQQLSKTNAFAAGAAVRRTSYPNEPFPPDSSGNGGSQGAAGPWVLADPTRAGNVYVVSINDPSNGATGDPADIVLARSIDYGQHWTTSTLEAGPNNSFQVFPTAAIDKFGDIVVAWWDNRNSINPTRQDNAGNYLLDVFAKYSKDGGLTWSPAFQVNDPSNPIDPQSVRRGDYFGVNLFGGTAYVIWGGNTWSSTDAKGDPKSGATVTGEQAWMNDFVISGSLTITDDDRSNNHIIVQDVPGNSSFAEVIENGKTEYAGWAVALDRITITGSTAFDAVDIEDNFSVPITVNLGSGTDTVNIDPTARVYNLTDINRDIGLNADVVVHGGGGVDTLYVWDQNDPAFKNWTVTGGQIRDSNFFDAAVDFDAISSVYLFGSEAGNLFTVQNTEPNCTTTIGTNGPSDTVNVDATTGTLDVSNLRSVSEPSVNIGNTTDGVQDIHGQVNVNSTHGHTNLSIDDTHDFNVQDPIIDATHITHFAPADITYDNGLNLLSIVGSSGANGFTVNDTPSGPTTFIYTGQGVVTVLGTTGALHIVGGSLVYVGQGSTQNIHGDVFVDNVGSLHPNLAMDLVVNDSQDAAGRTATLDNTGGMSDFSRHLYALTGITPTGAAISYEGDTLVGIDIKGTFKAANTFIVNSTGSAGTTLETDNGTATVNGTGGRIAVEGGSQTQIGNGTLSSIQGDVTVSAVGFSTSPSITLIVDDVNDMSGAVPTIAHAYGNIYSITGLTPAPATIYFDVTAVKTPLDIKLGTSAQVKRITNIPAGLGQVEIDLPNGQAFELGGSGTLDGIQSPVLIVGAGNNTVFFGDDGTTTPETYTLGATSLVRSGAAPISFNLVSGTVELLAGSGGNTIDITGSAPSVSVVVDVGAGGDAVNVGGPANTLDSIQGLLSIHGQGGNTTLNVHDDGNSVSENYTVSPTTIQRSIIVAGVYNFNIATITYYTVGHVNVYVGSAQMGVNQGALDYNTLDVVGTMAGTVTDLYGNNNGGQTAFSVAPYISAPTSSYNPNNQILGPVHIHGSSIGLDTLGYYDYFDQTAQSYTMTAGQMVDNGFAAVTYDGLFYGVGLLTSAVGKSTVSVRSTSPIGFGTQVQTNPGDVVTVGSQAPNLGGTLAGLAASSRLSIQTTDGNPNIAARVILDDSADTQTGKQVAFNTDSYGWGVSGLAPQRIYLFLGTGSSVQVLGGSPATGQTGGNTFNVQSTAPGVNLAVNAGAGSDTVNLGSAANSLDPITGVSVTGNGHTTLTLNDQGAAVPENYLVYTGKITRGPITSPPTGQTQIVTYSGLTGITLNGADAYGNVFFAVGTPAGTSLSLNAGSGGFNAFVATDEYNPADTSPGTDQLLGPVAFHGHHTSDFGERYDYYDGAGHTFTFSTAGAVSTVQRDGAADLTYDGLSQMILYVPKGGGNRLNVKSVAPGVFMNLTLSAGDQAVVGSAAPSLGGTTANVLGTVAFTDEVAGVTSTVTVDDSGDTGTAARRVTIAPLPSVYGVGSSAIGLLGNPNQGVYWVLNPGSSVALLGGTGDTTFALQGAVQNVSLSIAGGSGVNTLDYSQYVGDVMVNLQLGTATGVDGGIQRISNVNGSIGNDLLVGDANANILVGGTGRNVIIGGAGGDTLDASRATGDNILIGGTTDFDSNPAALKAIFAEWTRTDLSYRDRFSDLTSGTNGQGATPLNQVNGQLILLTSSTVHVDSSPDTLIGGNLIDPVTGKRVHNWFFDDADDTLVNFLKSSDHETKVK